MKVKILFALLLALCGTLLFFYVARNITIQETYKVFLTLDYRYFVCAWIINVCTTIVRGHKWNLLIGKSQSSDLVFSTNMYIVNNIINQILPLKLGELVTPYIINKFGNNKVSYLSRLTSLILDRIIEAMFLLILFIFSVVTLLCRDNMSHGIALLLIILSAVLSAKKILYLVPEFITERYTSLVSRIELPKLCIIKKLYIYTAIAYIGDILCFYFIFKAVTNDVDLLKVVTIFAISITLGILTMIPGGIGVVELITVRLLNQFGYDNHMAILTSVYIRSVGVVYIAIFSMYLISYLFFAQYIKRSKDGCISASRP